MDIGFYIADLLGNEDEVSLPGLGTFTKNRVPASYDPDSNSFTPPSYRISFINTVSELDSLARYVSAKKNLSLEAAKYFIQKFTSAISELLHTSGQAEIKPLGIIRRDGEQISFENGSDFNILGNFYGLTAVTELKYRVPETSGTVPSPVTVAATQKQHTIEDFIAGTDIDNSDEEEEDASAAPNRTPLFVLGGVLTAFIAAALLYLFNPVTRNWADNLFNNPSTAPITPVMPPIQDTARATGLQDSLNTTLPLVRDSSAADSIKELPVAAPVEVITFEIIGAAFGKRKEAENYIKEMKRRGLQARILENMPGPLFKVSLTSFHDRASAQKELNRIVNEVENEAWITEYKSTQTK